MPGSDVQIVLVAEDDPILRMEIEDILEEAGFQAKVTIDASEALATLEAASENFCALLTDIRMPNEGEGWGVARFARELQPSLPIIYMTGDSAEHWRAQGVPGSILLQKPFAPAQLITALAGLLNEAAMMDIPR
ncbi:response regulator [Rhizobium sp. SSA_523]|uniref:response regulator n=1 Tax=Rhizobium sp. SSA_523 TaxID=2952477 RepID=UPI002091A5C9|nr:response regulator [Rhizobium sp. SSA_523]MCO5732851.1 response regulator [Rhizobium sp. SSA_523]WKC23532.1 response regulator [Rhizobium sp. SSA_523]